MADSVSSDVSTPSVADHAHDGNAAAHLARTRCAFRVLAHFNAESDATGRPLPALCAWATGLIGETMGYRRVRLVITGHRPGPYTYPLDDSDDARAAGQHTEGHLARTLTYRLQRGARNWGSIAAEYAESGMSHADEQELFSHLAVELARLLEERERARHQPSHIIAAIHAGTAAATGDAFFRKLVACVGESLGVRFACLAELVSGSSAKTRAFWQHGSIVENLTYELRGTPCDRVLEQGTCCYPDNVATIFSEDVTLRELGARAFMGTPLLDHDGKPLGLLVVLHDAPIVGSLQMQQVLEVFAARAAAELSRNRAEEELREARKHMEQSLLGADLGTWEWDVPTGRIDYNERWVEMLGYTMENGPRTIVKCMELVHPDDLQGLTEAFLDHFNGDQSRYLSEHRVRTASGEYLWILDTGQILERNEDGHPLRVHGTHMDITARKEAERELAAARQRMELVLEGAALGTWDWHVPTGNVVLNDRFAQMVGYAREELAGDSHPWLSLIHPDDVSNVMGKLSDHITGTTDHYEAEYRLRHKDGHWLWVLDRGRAIEHDREGNPLRVCGTHLDITDRRKSAHMFEAFFDLSLHLHMIASAEGRILRINRAWERALGYTRDAIAGVHFAELVHPDDIASTTEAVVRLNDGETLSMFENRYRHADGSYRLLLWSARVLDDEGLIFGVATDITDERAAEIEREANHALLEGIIQQAPVPLVIADREGHIRYNDACASNLEPPGTVSNTEPGIRLKDVEPTWAAYESNGEMISIDDNPLTYALQGETTNAREIRIVTADGAERWHVLNAAPIFDARGHLLAAMATFPDITPLRQAENVINMFFDLALHLHIIADLNGIIERVNNGWYDQLGYRRDEMEGKAFYDFVHPEDVAGTRDAMARMNEGQVIDYFENRYRHRNGTYRVLVWSSKIAVDVQKVFGVASDITERRAAEEALQASEVRYRQMFQNNPAVKFIVDPKDGRILEVSRGAEKFYGYDADAFSRLRITDINTLPPDQVQAEMDRARTEERTYFNFRHRLASGDIRDVEVYSLPITIAGKDVLFSMIHDVTERKKAERALRKSEREYRRLLETTAEGFWMIGPDQSTVRVNAAMCDMLGYRNDEMCGRSPMDFTDTENREIFSAQLDRIPQREQRRYDIVLRRKDGQTVHARFNTTTLIDDDGNVTGAFAFVTDLSDQKRVEAALRASEHKLRSIRAAPIGLAVIRDRVFLDVNDYGTQLTGYRRHEVVGHSTRVLYVTEAEYDRVGRDLYQQMEQTGVGTAETVLLRKTGEPFRVIINATPLNPDDPARGQACCIMDITSRVEIEDALRRSEAELKRAQDIAKVGNYNWNTATGELQWSDQLYEILGVHGETPSLERFVSLIHPDDRERAVHQAERVQSEGTTLDIEYRIVRPDGDIRYVHDVADITRDAGGAMTSMFGTTQDITERKLAEEERERLMHAIEQAGETILITDAQGNIRYVNPAFEKSSGYAREEVIGRNPRILKSGNTDPAVYAELWETIRSGKSWTGRLVNKHKSGAIYTEDVVISPVVDADGRIVNFVAVKRDVTDELELEAQLRQSQKMEAVGQLTGGVAHDFNNMLQVMNMGAELALDELGAEHPACESLQQILHAGERAARLVSQLLLFSRRQIMQPEKLDINGVVAELLKMLGRVIGENIQLQWHPGALHGAVNADRSMIEQAIMNLTVNARDAMRSGGTLTIETSMVQFLESDPVTRTVGRPGQYVLITVRDTGVGIDDETMAHIFEPFFTTKGVGEGTGLGLATVYGILQQHGGWVTVDSEPNVGTVFCLYWPAIARKPAGGGELDDPGLAGGTETILLAEDDPQVRDLAVAILKRAGYTVHAAENGAEAVDQFASNAEGIDLVVLDLMMPQMDGRQAYDRIRQLNPKARVLFASGYSENVVSRDFVLEAGLNLIQKPFTRSELLQAVRELLD